MRVLESGNRARSGFIGVVLTILLVGVGQSIGSVPMLFATPTYQGLFADSGGLNAGDTVRLNGMDVGTVRSLKVDGDKVRIEFSLGDTTVGTDSRLSIRTDTILGKKVLEVDPRGTTTLRPNSVVPLDQSTTPYQLYDAIDDLTTNTAGWDVDSVKQSLDVLSETVTAAAPELSSALDGVAAFSDTIGKRDDQLNALLANANQVATVLGNRSEQINQLLVNAQALLAKFNTRRNDIDQLLGNVAAVSDQIEGFIADNPNLNDVLVQLGDLSDILVKQKNGLADVLSRVGRYVTAIAEAVGSGPFFKVMVANLLPGQFIQPFIDAAFKKRGIDPQEFWRDAGLPAYRFPDPNGQRFPNGAPPAAPTPLEGTPEFPGPAVPAGSPCSYTPGPEGIPSPQNPLPCAAQTAGPFGDNPYGANYGPPDVVGSAPNPAGPPPGPGLAAAAAPGQPTPTVPGTPVLLPPAPPAARTVPDPNIEQGGR